MSGHAYRVALAGLLRYTEPPVSASFGQFVAEIGAVAAWAEIRRGSAPADVLRAVAPRVAGRDDAALLAQAEGDLAAAAEAGAQILGPEDAQWPADSFAALEWTRPYDRSPTAWGPLGLYVRGKGIPSHGSSIAIVGSRAATPYGTRIAGELASDAVADRRTVVSGAAFGIDAAAHRGALASGGSPSYDGIVTAAVLPCGIDRAYPMAHRTMIDAIAESGAVLTEYAPSVTPARHRFLVRNRLIAALGEATIVVEAGRRSGSLNTATTAANLGRCVFAVPGPVTSSMSVGCLDSIREHRAELATCWSDVAECLGPLVLTAPIPGDGRPELPLDGLSTVASLAYEALPAKGFVGAHAVAEEAALPIGDALAGLALLEAHGLARRREGMWSRVPIPSSRRGRR